MSAPRRRAGAAPISPRPTRQRSPPHRPQVRTEPGCFRAGAAFHYDTLGTWLLIKQFASTGWFEIKMVIILQMTVTVFHKCGNV